MNVPPDMEYGTSDARRRLAEKRVLAAKIRQWRKERQERGASKNNTKNRNNTFSSSTTSGKRSNASSTSTRSKRYYGTYTAMMKNR